MRDGDGVSDHIKPLTFGNLGRSANVLRLELLLAISRKRLGVESFESTGKDALDVRMVSAEDVGRALESACDAGLIVGYRVARFISQIGKFPWNRYQTAFPSGRSTWL